MIIDCIADLHGHYPKLEGGDLLIVAGDLTARDEELQYLEFNSWLCKQDYRKVVLIAGNHDNYLQTKKVSERYFSVGCYLQDSGTEFEGLKIWGSPWTTAFAGINPRCRAFTVPFCEEEDELLSKKWELIPNDIDILITHSPPFGILDKTEQGWHVGSLSLRDHIFDRVKPKFHLFGHIHEWGGEGMTINGFHTQFINCSHVNERYEPVNKPIRIEL